MAHSFCTAVKQLSEQKKRRQDCLMSSTQSLYGLCLRSVAHSLVCSFPGNMPLLRMSTHHPGTSLHVISFTRPSPVLVLQATNTGVRWPGYEATSFLPAYQDTCGKVLTLLSRNTAVTVITLMNLTCATECTEFEGIHHTVSARSKGHSSPNCCVCTSQSVCQLNKLPIITTSAIIYH